MKCPLLTSTGSTCEAGSAKYSPSEFQLREYCKSGYHGKCPFYGSVLLRKKKAGKS